MRISFEKEHKKRFGFYVKNRKIFIEMLTVEAIGKSTEQENFIDIKDPDYNAQPIDKKKCLLMAKKKMFQFIKDLN